MTTVQADCCNKFRPRDEVHLHDRPYGPNGSPGKGCKAQAARNATCPVCPLHVVLGGDRRWWHTDASRACFDRLRTDPSAELQPRGAHGLRLKLPETAAVVAGVQRKEPMGPVGKGLVAKGGSA